MPSYVYLLAHPNGERFKLGKADDIFARILQLGGEQFALDRSEALAVATPEDAINLEKLMHRAFGKWRIDPALLIVEEGGRRDGDTEWFEMACWQRVTQFVDANTDLFGCTKIDSAGLMALVEQARLTAQPDDKAVRAALRAEKERRREQARLARATQRAQRDAELAVQFNDVVTDVMARVAVLKEHSVSMVLGPGENDESRYLVGMCTKENRPAVEALLEELFEAKLSSIGFGFSSVFDHYEMVDGPDGQLYYRLALRWQNPVKVKDLFDAARLNLREKVVLLPELQEVDPVDGTTDLSMV